jgi:hypothetical protein
VGKMEGNAFGFMKKNSSIKMAFTFVPAPRKLYYGLSLGQDLTKQLAKRGIPTRIALTTLYLSTPMPRESPRSVCVMRAIVTYLAYLCGTAACRAYLSLCGTIVPPIPEQNAMRAWDRRLRLT